MATEKRLIDANDVKELINGLSELPWEEEVDYLVDELPTVEVVLCKDCRYRIHDEVTNEWFCNSFHSGFVYAKPNDFCSYGERRTDE